MADPPVSLLAQPAVPPPSDLGQTIMSLLAPLVSGGQITNANDPGAVPAFLAFANRMAQAGAPTLGPPTPLATALPGAEAAGYGAGLQGRLYAPGGPLAQQIGLETQREQIGNDAAAFELARNKAIWSLTAGQLGAYGGYGGTAPTPPPGAPGGATPGSAAGPGGAGGPGTPPPATPPAPGQATAGTAQQFAALPDVQKLPDAARVPFIQMASQVGMAPDEASQYARMVNQESRGLQIDPKTGGILTSPAGALGVAQVMPGTFKDMATKYNIPGSANDLMSNLLAGGHYFHEGVLDSGLHNATVRYSAGPGGLQSYLQTGALPPETADYLVKTNTPPGATQVAGPGAGGTPLPAPGAAPALPSPGGPSGGGGLVATQDGRMVPLPVLQAAQAAFRGALAGGNPQTAIAAYNAEISKYTEAQAAGTMIPAGPGMQRNQMTGKLEEAPTGATITHTLTPAEVQTALGSTAIPGATYQVQMYAPGTPLAGQFKGNIERVDPRGGNATFQQVQDANKEVENQPGYSNWDLAYNRFNNAIDSLNLHTQVGDEGAIFGYAKILDPGAVVRDGRLESTSAMGGVPGWLSQEYAHVFGGAPLTDNLRQQLGQIMQVDMSARDRQMLMAVNQGRQQYNDLFDGNYIKRGGLTTAVMSQADAAREGLDLDGITFQQPYTWDPNTATYTRPFAKPAAPAKITRPMPGIGGPPQPLARPAPPPPATPPGGGQGGAGAGGAQVQPATPPPAVAAPGAPGAAVQPPATAPAGPRANVLSDNYLAGLTPAGADNLRQQMIAHPQTYTDADRARFSAYLKSRLSPPPPGAPR